MKKDKDAYINFVCPHCWNTLDNCICELFPPYYLIFIDRNIQEHIRILNKKKYLTTGCCEGHREVCISTYITFANDYLREIDMPKGFRYDKKRRMIAHTYSTKLSEEKMEEFKKENLETLLEWCKSLPDRNTEN